MLKAEVLPVRVGSTITCSRESFRKWDRRSTVESVQPLATTISSSTIGSRRTAVTTFAMFFSSLWTQMPTVTLRTTAPFSVPVARSL